MRASSFGRVSAIQDDGSTTKQMTALKNSCSVTTKETLYCDAAACACCFREYRMTRTKPAFCTSIKVSATHFLVAADIGRERRLELERRLEH